MNKDIFWEIDSSREEHTNPGQTVKSCDILSDDMEFTVPVFEIFFDISCRDTRNVICESITPDIHHMVWVIWYRDSPGELFLCAREADIFESVTDHRYHLILTEFWRDLDFTTHDLFFDGIAVSAESEKIVLIFGPAGRSSTFLEAFIFIEFFLGHKSLFTVTIVASIGFFIDISFFYESHPERLYYWPVLFLICRSDIAIV